MQSAAYSSKAADSLWVWVSSELRWGIGIAVVLGAGDANRSSDSGDPHEKTCHSAFFQRGASSSSLLAGRGALSATAGLGHEHAATLPGD
jgi:hypothetical protein